MIEGLLWLPLLAVFFALAWAGRREFQKIEAYTLWSRSFTKAKYDIYSVLGQKEGLLVWGKPTYRGIVDEQKLEIKQITAVNLTHKGKIVDVAQGELTGSGDLSLSLKDSSSPVIIPFTRASLAAQWVKELQEQID